MARQCPGAENYTIACICPMGVELASLMAMFDETYDPPVALRAQNAYTAGRIGVHNVIVTNLAKTGNNPAAGAAMQTLNDFPWVRFGLLVGVGGGVPGPGDQRDIRLGDIVVSEPGQGSGGVVQFDRGDDTTHDGFKQTHTLDKPPTFLLNQIEKLKATHMLAGSQVSGIMKTTLDNQERLKKLVGRLGPEMDKLFLASYDHQTGNNCDNCDPNELVSRPLRDDFEPVIHYGTIGSSNRRIQNAVSRDRLRDELGIICVEMEAAGVMDDFPCLVIRGICDYADSHVPKTKTWQPYAALAAAAYAKELLLMTPLITTAVPRIDVEALRRQFLEACRSKLEVDPGRKLELSKVLAPRESTCQWFFDTTGFIQWSSVDTQSSRYLSITGNAGSGKSVVMCAATNHLKSLQRQTGFYEIVCEHYFDGKLPGRSNSRQTFAGLVEAMLSQIIVQFFKHPSCDRDFLANLKEQLSRETFPDNRGPVCEHEILNILRTSVNPPLRLWVVVDALDECGSDDEFIKTKKFLDLITKSGETTNEVRLLVSFKSGPKHTVELGVLAQHAIEVHRHNTADIKHFVDDRVSAKNLNEAAKSNLRQLLEAKANGCFQWVDLALQVALSPSDDSSQDLEDTIAGLPEELGNLYHRILRHRLLEGKSSDRKFQQRKQEAVTVFQLLLFAERPLQPAEIERVLFHGAKLNANGKSATHVEKRDGSSSDFSNHLVWICCGLVEVTSEAIPVLQFTHDSVRTYFQQLGLAQYQQAIPQEFQSADNEAVGHYLLFSIFLQALRQELASTFDKDVSLDYLTQYWPEHAKRCEGLVEKHEPEYMERLACCTGPGETKNSLLPRQYIRRLASRRDRNHFRPHDIKTLPMLIAVTGCLLLLQRHLKKCRCTEPYSEFSLVALSSAAYAGEDKIVTFLLGSQPDNMVDAPLPIRGITPLYQACYRGQVDVVRVLLAKGAKLNRKTRQPHVYPLHVAAAHGRLSVVKFILDKHDPEEVMEALRLKHSDDEHGMTPLEMADVFDQPATAREIESWG